MIRYYDPDLGYLHAHLDDNGDVEIHRDSEVSGHTVIPLGIAARQLAMDVLTLSGQADGATVQYISDMLVARAKAGDALSIAEMRGVAATLRTGCVPFPDRMMAKVVQFRRVV